MKTERKIVWAVWVLFLVSLLYWTVKLEGFVPLHLAGDGFRLTAPVVVACGAVALSVVLRWGVLPRVRKWVGFLGVYVVALAFAEIGTFVALIAVDALNPTGQSVAWILSLAGVGQCIPVGMDVPDADSK